MEKLVLEVKRQKQLELQIDALRLYTEICSHLDNTPVSNIYVRDIYMYMSILS